MKIETKYNVGDEVWTYGDYYKGYITGEIQDLKVTSVFLDITPTIAYTVRRVINGKVKLYHRFESELFPTKEELIKSLRYGME